MQKKIFAVPPTQPNLPAPGRPQANMNILRANRIVMGLYNDPRADTFRVLRTNILRQLKENHWNSFGVSSISPEAGKTVISVNLAIAIAREGNQKVLLVDADLRRPKLAEYLGLKTELGLVDYLTGEATLDRLFLDSGFSGLTIIPGRNYGTMSTELISSAAMATLVEDIKGRYENGIVIFDIPPLFVADDFLLLIRYLDSTVLVVEDARNTPAELQDALHILEQTNLLGLILNKAAKPMGRMYSYNPLSQGD